MRKTGKVVTYDFTAANPQVYIGGEVVWGNLEENLLGQIVFDPSRNILQTRSGAPVTRWARKVVIKGGA